MDSLMTYPNMITNKIQYHKKKTERNDRLNLPFRENPVAAKNIPDEKLIFKVEPTLTIYQICNVVVPENIQNRIQNLSTYAPVFSVNVLQFFHYIVTTHAILWRTDTAR